ncbi:MAG TPA: hypothetical protein VII91_06500 [Bauldia sp.]
MAEAFAELTEPAADVVLHRAALAAGKAFGGATLRKAALGETAALLGWLKSDRPIGRGERLIQANLIAGHYCAAGRPRIEADPRRAYRALIKKARSLRRSLRDGRRGTQNCSPECHARRGPVATLIRRSSYLRVPSPIRPPTSNCIAPLCRLARRSAERICEGRRRMKHRRLSIGLKAITRSAVVSG